MTKMHIQSGLRSTIHLFLTFSLLLLVVCANARAQSTQGTILGSIHDSSGAIVPNADVILTSIDEGTIRTTRSSAGGEYRFVDLKAGHYTITADAPGYAKWTANGVVLAVRQELRIDVKLAIGQVRQKVVVTGNDVSAIDTDTPTISGVLTVRQHRKRLGRDSFGSASELIRGVFDLQGRRKPQAPWPR